MHSAAESKWRPLGALLVEQGVVTTRELEEGLAEQARTGEKLGEILVNRGFASRTAIVDALAEQSGQILAPEGGFGTGLRALMKRRPRNTAPAASENDAAAAEPDGVDEPMPVDEPNLARVEASVVELRPQVEVAEVDPSPDAELVAELEPLPVEPVAPEPDPVARAQPAVEDALRAELETAHAALAAAEERLERERVARADLEADSAERAALRNRVGELEQAKAELEAELAERAAQLRAANETVAELEAAGLEAELTERTEQLRMANETIAQLQAADYEADSAERAALRTRLGELEQVKAELEAVLAGRAEQLRAANETIAQLQTAGLEAELRLQSLERRLADTHAALERFLAFELHAPLAAPRSDAALPPERHTSVTVSADTAGAAGRLAAGA